MSKSKFIVFVVLYMLIFINCQGKKLCGYLQAMIKKN